MDCALYFALTGVPYKAIELEAGPWVMGLLPAAYSLVYAASALNSGRLTHPGRRLSRALWLLPWGVAALVSLSWARHWLGLFIPLAVLGFALSFFWPPLQALLADLSPARKIAQNLGVFNIAWSSGKGFGFLLGGVLLQLFGFTALFWAAAAMGAAVWFLARGLHARGSGLPVEAGPRDPVHPRHTAFMISGWLANTLAFGSVAVLNYHYPKHLIALGLSPSVFGACLGTILLTQTAVFWALRRYRGWHHRAGILLGSQALMAGMLFLLPRMGEPVWILALAPFLGLGIGVAYYSSLYYSVEDPKHRGRNAGVHEGALALGAVTLPLFGAAFSGTTAGPILATAVVIAAGLAAQVGILTLSGKPRGGPAV